jgi:HPt (histidine-containing phosphotransfer) domain-containing protein
MLADAMNRLWKQFLPQIEDRVSTLEKAAAALREGSLTPAQRDEAYSDAHKLAGVLGTFGLDRGTELAREAEQLYASGSLLSSNPNGRPAELASQLRDIVATRSR